MGTAAALFCGVNARAAMLDGPRLPPRRAPAKFLIVLLHGYGSNGADMIGLAPSFQPYAPTAAFAAPNGPYRIDDGYSWFTPQAPNNPGSAQARQAQAAAGGGPALDAFIEAELARDGLPPERLILLGFSQGASTVLNTGLRRKVPPTAIIAFSGANLSPVGLSRRTNWPPVLLIQGDQDPRVSVAAQQQALRVLKDIGAPATAHLLPGLGHEIDDRGIRLAGELLRSVTRA
jgi:phospholipase/carboxylesterase